MRDVLQGKGKECVRKRNEERLQVLRKQEAVNNLSIRDSSPIAVVKPLPKEPYSYLGPYASTRTTPRPLFIIQSYPSGSVRQGQLKRTTLRRSNLVALPSGVLLHVSDSPKGMLNLSRLLREFYSSSARPDRPKKKLCCDLPYLPPPFPPPSLSQTKSTILQSHQFREVVHGRKKEVQRRCC